MMHPDVFVIDSTHSIIPSYAQIASDLKIGERGKEPSRLAA